MTGRLRIKLAPELVIFPFPSLSLRGYLISQSQHRFRVSIGISMSSFVSFSSVALFLCLSLSHFFLSVIFYVVSLSVYFCENVFFLPLSFSLGLYFSVSLCDSPFCLFLFLFPLCLSPIYLCLLGCLFLSLSLSLCIPLCHSVCVSIVSECLCVSLLLCMSISLCISM